MHSFSGAVDSAHQQDSSAYPDEKPSSQGTDFWLTGPALAQETEWNVAHAHHIYPINNTGRPAHCSNMTWYTHTATMHPALELLSYSPPSSPGEPK